MIIERLSEDTLFLPISARKGVFLLPLQDYLADKETVRRSSKRESPELKLWTLSFLSFDTIIVLGDTHHEINRIGDIEQ